MYELLSYYLLDLTFFSLNDSFIEKDVNSSMLHIIPAASNQTD
jgi:hypothetical protein